MSTWPNRGVPPAAWQGPKDKKQQPKTNSPNRLTHRNTDSPKLNPVKLHFSQDPVVLSFSTSSGLKAKPCAQKQAATKVKQAFTVKILQRL